jgi:hypothetical protein
MNTPYITIKDSVIEFSEHPAEGSDRGARKYQHRPVQVALHRDLTLEVHGEDFSVSTKLSVDDALGLITILGYAVRERLFTHPPKGGAA